MNGKPNDARVWSEAAHTTAHGLAKQNGGLTCYEMVVIFVGNSRQSYPVYRNK